ncbi:hypothetical protein [Frigoriglobus tundricola]|uniref:Glycosyltransferase RgtA/B/C/D-like domain-containing protein n=1 Tax=Frigoriglobus tundricola TaxID=2774151 RepID=A0A6M5YW48_9BACT|nr:hypothetical protein [Frigoriglobus tundricola]QJW97433.1 hypothetical protein FTUN_5007 [Frigoriglobus tundricola]
MLVAGVPLFLCMPPWTDVTLYDMAARAVLRGGVYYRDVFDTNLPGMGWSMAAVRYGFGPSYEALRAADLVVIGATVAALCGWVRRCGGTGYAVAWFVAAAALFYPFLSEFNHVQRDPWLLLPAIVAARLRLRRVARLIPPAPGEPAPNPSLKGGEQDLRSSDASRRAEEAMRAFPPLPSSRPREAPLTGPGREPSMAGGVGSSILEGFVWGLAVWLKPHVVVPALAVWAVSAVLLARREPRKRIVADLGGLILGGLLAGAPGVLWLVGTGAWPYFLDIFLNWNPDYLSESGSVQMRFNTVFNCFRPWSLVQFLALPTAALSLWEARVWSRRPCGPRAVPGSGWFYQPAGDACAVPARALLAACYLGWLAQVVLIQKAFDYVHVPLVFLGMTVVAGQRWCFGFAYLLWFGAVGVLMNAADVSPPLRHAVEAISPPESRLRPYVHLEKHPLADGEVMTLWPRCWTEGGSAEMRDRLGQYTDVHCGTRWRELEKVAAYLRTVDPPLGPGELNCWHDGTHPLYLMLDLDPATRYMHFGTAFGIRSKRASVAAEVAASRQRYVVSDLLRTNWDRTAAYAPAAWRAGDPLPVWLPPNEREKFPWNQPVVFRSGRYLVHRLDPTKPLGVIRVPDWDRLDKLAEFGPDE